MCSTFWSANAPTTVMFACDGTIVCGLQIGFLYLRYVGDPKSLWSWYEPYLEDDQVCCSGEYAGGPLTRARLAMRSLTSHSNGLFEHWTVKPYMMRAPEE